MIYQLDIIYIYQKLIYLKVSNMWTNGEIITAARLLDKNDCGKASGFCGLNISGYISISNLVGTQKWWNADSFTMSAVVGVWTQYTDASQTSIDRDLATSGFICASGALNGSEVCWSNIKLISGKYNVKVDYISDRNTGILEILHSDNDWKLAAPTCLTETSGNSYIMSMCELSGTIYGGTYPNGRLLRWNGIDEWEIVAEKLGSVTTIYSLCSLSGVIYGGTYPTGELLRWNGVNAWNSVASKYETQDFILALLAISGKIYGGEEEMMILEGHIYYDGMKLMHGIVLVLLQLPEWLEH